MVCVAPEGLWHDSFKLCFDFLWRLARRQPRPVAHAEDMRIDRKGFLAERGVEHYVCSLATHAWKRLELVTQSRDFASVMIEECLAQRDDVLRFGVEQTDCLDCLSKAFFSKFDHLLGRLDDLEERLGGDVDSSVGRLGREHDGN